MTTEASSPAVALFQKVHGKMVMLQRLDAQLGGLLEQRRKVQQEIQQLQGHINEEIDRQLRQADELPAKILTEIAETGRNGERSPMGMPSSPSPMGPSPSSFPPPRLADVERTPSSEVSLSNAE
jgi:hypothetical protein